MGFYILSRQVDFYLIEVVMKKLSITKFAKADPRVTKLVKDIKKNPKIKKRIQLLSNKLQIKYGKWKLGKYKLFYSFIQDGQTEVVLNFWIDAGPDDPFVMSVTDNNNYLRGRGIRMGSPISIFKTLDSITSDDYGRALFQIIRL